MGRTGDSTTYVVGRASTPGVPETRQFLSRNGVPFQWVDVENDPLVDLLNGRAELEGRRYPLALFADGSILEGPERYMLTRHVHHTPSGMASPVSREDEQAYDATARFKQQLAERVGLPTRPAMENYDVVVIGAGPAGLTAALNSASEGLTTLVVESTAPGGQAGTSARIENYPGFAQGISGAELAGSIHTQATRLGAEILVGAELTARGTRSRELGWHGDPLRLRTWGSRSAQRWRRRHRRWRQLRRPGGASHGGARPGRDRDCARIRPQPWHVELPRGADRTASADHRSNRHPRCGSSR
jgi:hypothetical protein